MRLRSTQRLRRGGDIQSVRERGRRHDAGHFVAWGLMRPDDIQPPATLPRVAVIASTHAVGGAVQRNRARRRLRELFRLHQERLPRLADIVLTARRSLLKAAMSELGDRFDHAARRLFAET